MQSNPNPNKSERIEKTVLKELSVIIKHDLDLDPNLLLTLTKVETSKDHHYATVWVSFYPENEADETLKLLNKSASYLQWLLRKRIKLGYIPNLTFKYDKGIAQGAKVSQLIDKNKLESGGQEI